MTTELYFDGASKGNGSDTAIAGAGWIVKNKDYNYSGSKYLGCQTNNYAEYMALIYGLESLLNNNPECVIVYGDSLLVINQSKGLWKIKAANLIPLNIRVKELISKFKKIEFNHIDRSLNFEADKMANYAVKNLEN